MTPDPSPGPASDDGLAAGGKVGAGRYTLIARIGKGGFGVVWRARDERLNEEAALKFLPEAIRSDATALEDMRREARKSRRLTHPHIVRIHDLFDPADEGPFIAMEYVEGDTLHTLKAAQPQRLFDWDYLKPLVRQLCEALAYAHEEGIVHRDLKPANMMVDGRGRLKLADFGIAATATEITSRLTRHPGSSGTPPYMSPQQMTSQTPRATDDIYSLGATLYELLSSKPPFYAGDIYRQVQEAAPVPLAERLADLGLSNAIPSDVAALVMACLAKDPGQRPQSARAVAEWIGLEIDKPAPSVSRTPGSRRWRVAAGATIAVLAATWVMISMRDTGQPPGVENAPMGGRPWTNSLGMSFVPVPGTDLLFSIWETRNGDYAAFAEANSDVDDTWRRVAAPNGMPLDGGTNHPVVNVSWHDAGRFCAWLTQKEKEEGWLAPGQFYGLPTDPQWSAAVGLTDERRGSPKSRDGGVKNVYPWGAQWPPPPGSDNYADSAFRELFPRPPVIEGYSDGFATTAPVGSFAPNQFGLHDLGGNVGEWCFNRYEGGKEDRVVRGGAWARSDQDVLLSSHRTSVSPDTRQIGIGFRVVLRYATAQ